MTPGLAINLTKHSPSIDAKQMSGVSVECCEEASHETLAALGGL